MRRLNLGIVGCGDIAYYMALTSLFCPRVRISACCDKNLEKLNRFAKNFRIKEQFRGYEELLNSNQVDAVYLSVPHHLHSNMILAAARIGKPVFVEKPLTRTYEEGVSLLPQVENIKVGVNYQYRYNRGFYRAARAVQSGQLGSISTIRVNIPWHRTWAYFDNAPWHKTFAEAGGGTLITQGSHALDIALWALGEPPITAMGYTSNYGFDVEVETITQGIVETQSGTLISITSSMVAATEQAVTVDFYGNRGTILCKKDRFPQLRIRGTRIKNTYPPTRGLFPIQRSLIGFTDWVLDDKPYLTPANQALPVLAAVDGIYRSVEFGTRVPISF